MAFPVWRLEKEISVVVFPDCIGECIYLELNRMLVHV